MVKQLNSESVNLLSTVTLLVKCLKNWCLWMSYIGELLVVACQRHGASLWAHRRSHSAVGAYVVRNQVVSSVRRVVEMGRWAVGAGGRHAVGMHWWGLGSGPAQTPGAAHERLQIEGTGQFCGTPGHVGHTRWSIWSPHPPSPPVVSFLKHVLECGVQHPKVSFLVPSTLSRNFDKALIQRQIVPYAILPTFFVLLIIGEMGHDEVVYSSQGLSLLSTSVDCHRDESNV